MTRYIAFLKAINVGGRNVKMEELRQIFQSMAFTNVETFIASGNVIFETDFHDYAELQVKIEHQLLNKLGYEVSTFLRTDRQLAKIAQYKPFNEKVMSMAVAFNVGFMKQPLNKEQQNNVLSLSTDIDYFNTHHTELYWTCQTRQSESTIDAKKLERVISKPITLRTIKTIYRLTAKYPPANYKPE